MNNPSTPPSRKIKACVISSAPAPYRIGLFEKIARLPGLDAKVFFLGKTCGPWNWDMDMGGDFPFEFVEMPSLIPKDRYAMWFHPRLPKIIKDGKYDVVVIGGYFIPSLIMAVAWCRLRGIPYIMWSESHGGMQRSGIKKLLRPLLVGPILTGAAAHFAVGSDAKKLLVDSGVKSDRIYIILNAPDVKAIAARSTETRKTAAAWKKSKGLGNGPTALFVGRLVEDKGIDLMLDAYASIAKKGVNMNLIMVGRGPLADRIEARIKSEGLKNVAMEGFVPPEKVMDYYGYADFLVLPSLHEPFGAVVHEALAAGLPVVASSAVGAVADLVDEGATGFVFPTGDTKALAGVFERICSNPGTTSAMADKCVERAKKFDHESASLEFLKGVETAIAAARV